MQHINTSGFEALLYPTVNREGRETGVAIVRATFQIGRSGRLEPAAEQIPVRMEDVFFGEPGASSSLEESDLAVYKPGTDVIVVGEALAPHERPASTVHVGVRVGDLQKTAVVLGDRIYHRMFGGGPLVASKPMPFTKLPLVWERTFGGSDPSAAGGDRPRFDARNPVGCGFGTATPGQKLPNIYPDTDYSGSGQEPCGFLPVGRGWLPRYLLAGTYDAQWQKERAPFLPRDFDYRFLQCAPPGLVSAKHLRGDEPVRILNMSPEGLQAFTLPGLVMGLTIRVDRKPPQKCLAALDTVVLEPVRRRVMLVWRRAIACRRSTNEILQVISFAVSRGGARTAIGAEADWPIGEPTWIS